jgi:glycosyltransferase involved in cell wall biosynthesis
MRPFDVTVVIPTRGRRAPLDRALRALGHQHFAPNRFEAVVAVDGPDDGTDAQVAALDLPYSTSVVHSDAARGAGGARNRGASAASGDLLVFMDDDIEAGPDLVGAHVAAHREGAQVTIGYLPPGFEGGQARDFFQAALGGWWEAMFGAMRQEGHRYQFRDLLTGNFALAASLFERVGGFDPAFVCHEDNELGMRLVGTGAAFRFEEASRGVHHERTTVGRSFVRKQDEGRADVLMLDKYPELVPVLPLTTLERHGTRLGQLLRRLAFERPRAGRLLSTGLARLLPALERARLRGRWTRLLNDLLAGWYWMGVAGRLPSEAALQEFRASCRARSTWSPLTLEVDLVNGLELLMAQIDRRRPAGLRVAYKGQVIGEIPPVPGSEGLTGRHLRAALTRELAGPFVAALGRAGIAPVVTGREEPEATGPLPTDVVRF